MAGKEVAVKKYGVPLSTEERKQLSALIRFGQTVGALVDEGAHPFVKAAVSNAGEGWSDGKVAEALDSSGSEFDHVGLQVGSDGLRQMESEPA